MWLIFSLMLIRQKWNKEAIGRATLVFQYWAIFFLLNQVIDFIYWKNTSTFCAIHNVIVTDWTPSYLIWIVNIFSITLVRPRLANFSVKDQIVNILGFPSHMLCTSTTQLCYYNVKTAIGNISTNRYGCLPVTLSLQKHAGLVHSL